MVKQLTVPSSELDIVTGRQPQRDKGAHSAGPYSISFYRELVNDSGARYQAVLHTLYVSDARSREDAILEAIARFEREKRVRRWDDLAHGYSCIEQPCNELRR